jgi:thioredoxin 1
LKKVIKVPIVNLDNDNFEKTVASDNIVLVDCWAAWCGACTQFAPVYEKIASRHPNHVFAKLDTQSQKELVDRLGIENIPSLLLYRDGTLLFKQPGYFSEEQMEDIVHQAESLDMKKVRMEIEAETKTQSEKKN